MMIFLKLLVSSGLIFITATASTRNESLCYQPSKYVIPMHYDIMLSTFIEGNIFYGEYNISINILNKTKHIYLHSGQLLCIKNIVLITNIGRYHENDKDTVYKPTYNKKENTIDISFMDELSPGKYTLNIEYYGAADEVFRIYDMNETTTWVGDLHFQIIGARPFFQKLSCLHLHDLRLKATFNISIKCDLCTALSNMPLRNTKLHKHDMLWIQNDTTPVMWPDHATIIVSNNLFHIFHIDNEIIKMWSRIDTVLYMEFASDVVEKITLFFKNTWKDLNHISMVSHVAIPNFHEKSTIIFGLVIYRETDIIYDENLYPIAQKMEVAQFVGHKVTQEWFHNMMNNPLVSDFWFKKGLTTLLATYAVNKTYPDFRIINLFVVQNQHYSLNLDGNHMWPSTSQDDSLLKIRQSIRAPFILRMMEHVLGKDIFRTSITVYVFDIRSHDIDFVNLTRHVALNINPNIDLQLTRMENWVSEKNCPLIKVVQNYNDMNETYVSIQYIDTLKIDCLPVTFTTEASLDFNNFTQHIVCVSRDLKLSLPFEEYGWIIFNIQQIGYYRVTYDDKNWERITYYLNAKDHTKIHVLNRAQIIDDAFHLMIAGQLNISIFWDIMSYLAKEEDYIAWYPMFKALEYMFNIIPVVILKEKIQNYKFMMKDVLHEILQKTKFEEIGDRDNLRTCLRQEAARWACLLDDYTCKEEANKKLQLHIKDPKTHRLLPWWKEWTYCKGLMIATEETWQLVYDIGLEKSDTKFLEYLACTEDTNMIKNYLTYKNITHRKYHYHLNSFLPIITKHAKNPTILPCILDNFLNIRPKHVNIPAALIIIINNVCFVDQTELIEEYVEKWNTNLTDIDHIMNNTENLFNIYHIEKDVIMKNFDKIKSKISIRKNQINRQIKYYESIRSNWRK